MGMHIHLVSDATGETIGAIARACLAQFAGDRPHVHHWYLVRSQTQLEQVFEGIREYPGLVLYTFVDYMLHAKLDQFCAELTIPSVPILDPTLAALAGYLGQPSQARPGKQHQLDADYFRRIDAMDFTLQHDDGQIRDNLHEADVVLVGVSRTSKTPTSVYLANRGIKCANVPFVPGRPLPESLTQLTKPLVVGLTVDIERLLVVRRTRLKYLGQGNETDYINEEKVRDELLQARRFFTAQQWPVIDVTRRSIEETAAEIITMLNQRSGGAGLLLS